MLGSLGRLLHSAVAIAHTRLEIFGIELAEERDRLFSLVLFTLLALTLAGIGLLSLTALVVIVFWNSYHWQPLAIMTAIYLIVAVGFAGHVRSAIRTAASPFEATRAEFEKDRALFERPRRPTED